MRLILVRHAQQTPGDFSFSAELTDQGRLDLAKTISHLDQKNTSPDVVYTSPLKRAVESAEMIASHFSASLLVEEALGDYFDPNVLIQILQEAQEKTVCFVGHAPSLPDFARRLCPEASSISRGCALVLDVTITDTEIEGMYNTLVTPEG